MLKNLRKHILKLRKKKFIIFVGVCYFSFMKEENIFF